MSTIQDTSTDTGDASATAKTRKTYPQDWPAYNSAQTQEKEMVAALLHDLCNAIETPPQGRGRPRLPLPDVIFAAVMKVYGTMSGRRSMTDLREFEARGYMAKAPSYNSIFDYLDNPVLTPLLRAMIEESSRPVREVEADFAIDSTGFSTSVHKRWFDAKYGRVQSVTEYVKAHAMVGVTTNIVTSAEATPGNINDYPLLTELLGSTIRRFDVARVCADKGYSGRSNIEAIRAAGAVPFVAFKSNAKAGPPSAWRDSFESFRSDPDAFYRRYHKRSNVETTFSMIKAKFGGFVRSKTPQAQRNEVLCKVLAHNLCVLVQSFYELGIEPQFWTEGNAALSESYCPTWKQNLPARAPWTFARKKGRTPCHMANSGPPLFGNR